MDPATWGNHLPVQVILMCLSLPYYAKDPLFPDLHLAGTVVFSGLRTPEGRLKPNVDMLFDKGEFYENDLQVVPDPDQIG